jgi:hypothetical protein
MLVVLSILAGMAPHASAQLRPLPASAVLTNHDRVDIELLSARYALALGSCDAKTWPELFVAPDGYFSAGPRGKVQGHHRLGEMIRSYNCHYVDGVAPAHAPGVSVPYKIEIARTRDGATGTAFYNGGQYQDVYVKTPQGWRFRSRTVVTNTEQAANWNAEDFDAIQQLAAAHGGPYRDVYEPIPGGMRFQSAGLTIDVKPDGIHGKAYPANDSGHYDDVYVKSAAGWRFKSRVYVPAE